MKLSRPIETWIKVQPASVASGSEAMVRICIEDMRSDILALHQEITRLLLADEAHPDTTDNRPRYSMKRVREELSRVKVYVRSEALEEAAKVAECHFDDRGNSRSGHHSEMDWADGYREATRGAACAIRAIAKASA